MCTSPPCPGGCETPVTSGHPRRQRMRRAYVKVFDTRKKQRLVPVGWWCPGCHAFRCDLP